MGDRYIVKASLSVAPWPSDSEEAALQKAAELFDKYGSDLEIEILLNDRQPPLYGTAYMAKWNKNRKSN